MIKNETIRRKIEKKTEQDLIMRKFLEDIIANDYQSTNYSKAYKKAIEEAVKAKGE